MRYVDAGYAAALATLAAYAVSLVARRRRWERAYRASEEPSPHLEAGPSPEAEAAAASRERS